VGSESDKLEVLDPLPVPVIAHLVDGEDKMIGDDEVTKSEM
jgi:hypothetical protein